MTQILPASPTLFHIFTPSPVTILHPHGPLYSLDLPTHSQLGVFAPAVPSCLGPPFSPIFVWLSLSHHSAFRSNVTSSDGLSTNVAIPSAILSPITMFYFLHGTYLTLYYFSLYCLILPPQETGQRTRIGEIEELQVRTLNRLWVEKNAEGQERNALSCAYV